MPSSVYYSGILKYVPGGISKVNADALNPAVVSANGNVFLVGEADAGQPGTIFQADEMRSIKDAFISGDLVDAANIAFAPSNDPLIPGGASRIFLYKTNNSTQSTTTIPSAPASQLISSTVTGTSATTLVDSAQITGSVDDQYNGHWLVLRPLTSTMEIKKVTDYTASTGTFTVGSAWTSNPVVAEPYLLLSDTVNLMDKVAAGSTTTVINTTVTNMVASEHVGRWAYIHRVGATPDLRRITANTTSTITVSPSLPAAPTASAYVEILANAMTLTSKNWGESQNSLSLDLATSGLGKTVTVAYGTQQEVASSVGGVVFLHILFKGAPVSVNDTVAASSTTSVINLTTGGLTPSAQVGKQVFIDGEYTTITANTASALTVSPALSAAPDVGSTVTIYNITRAVAKITGTAGKATALTTQTGIVGADLNITFPAGQTLRQLASSINLNTNYFAFVPPYINGDLAFAADFDFGSTVEISMLNSAALVPTVGFKQNSVQLVNYLTNVSQYVSAVRATTGAYDGSQVAGDIADPIFLTGGTRGVSTNSNFQAGLDAALTVRANSVVPLIDQDMVNDGFGSTATFASVAAQLRDHVIQCRGVIASERGGYIGMNGTKLEVIDQAVNLNDMDVHLLCQSPVLLNTTGSLVEYGPRMYAAMAAGCRAGVSEVAEPITHKVVKVSGVSQDSSWDPNVLTDANDMIKAGVLFSYTDANNITRWCRDLTTWTADNNLAYSEGSVRDAVRYVVYGLREGIVARFTGRKAKPATIKSVKDYAIVLLEQYRSGDVIVDSTDLATGEALRAYRNLKITSSGDVMKLTVCITPVPGINFTLFDIELALATQAA